MPVVFLGNMFVVISFRFFFVCSIEWCSKICKRFRDYTTMRNVCVCALCVEHTWERNNNQLKEKRQRSLFYLQRMCLCDRIAFLRPPWLPFFSFVCRHKHNQSTAFINHAYMHRFTIFYSPAKILYINRNTCEFVCWFHFALLFLWKWLNCIFGLAWRCLLIWIQCVECLSATFPIPFCTICLSHFG